MKVLILFLLLFSVACSEPIEQKNDDDTMSDSDQTNADSDSETGDEDQISMCERLEKVTENYIDTSGVTNKAIGIIIRVESPKISETCGFGSLVKGAVVPLTGKELWVIGSVSKMITSYILAEKAVAIEGLLDDPAENYLPEEWVIPVGSGGEKFSLLNLMIHTSGLPHYPQTLQASLDNVAGLEDMYAAWEDYTIENLENDIEGITLSANPGTAYIYSDFGFALAQQAVENIYEKSFPDLLEDFSTRMGLKNTVVPENLSEEQKNNLFYGHGGPRIVAMETPVVTPVFTGDGFIYSDAEDLGRLLRIFAGIDETADPDVTKALGLVTEKRFPREAGEVSIAQGLGIGIITEGEFTLYKKNGTSVGTTTAFLWDDKNHIGVAVAGNIIPFGEGINSVVCDAYRLLYLDHTGLVLPEKVLESCQVAF